MLGALALSATAYAQGWPQWGQNPQHSGFIPAFGQSPAQKLANMVYDPFVAQEQGENGGELLAHYQAPLTNARMCSWNLNPAHMSAAIRPDPTHRSLVATTTGSTRSGMKNGFTGRPTS
jgi:hypothetical protein